MTTKSDIDRMLETLDSFRGEVPAHVRQLLRLLAARCDEVEQRLKTVVEWLMVMNYQLDKVEGKDTAPLTTDEIEKMLEAGPTDAERKAGEQDAADALAARWDAAINDETKHLLSSPKNAAALEKSIKQARATAKDKHEDEGSFW